MRRWESAAEDGRRDGDMQAFEGRVNAANRNRRGKRGQGPEHGAQPGQACTEPDQERLGSLNAIEGTAGSNSRGGGESNLNLVFEAVSVVGAVNEITRPINQWRFFERVSRRCS